MDSKIMNFKINTLGYALNVGFLYFLLTFEFTLET